jgi:DNA-binding transcriptional regulator YiaG
MTNRQPEAEGLPSSRARASTDNNNLLRELLDGRDLRHERTQRRMTQTQLAAQVGTTVFAVNRWERGVGLPCAVYLVRLRRWIAA